MTAAAAGSPAAPAEAPLVSVVTATYNRSNVLRFAIESVRRQTVASWEMIVVGDACTDDTAAVVASFGDPRIRFVNLAENVGEQSGPNNEGVRLSRGRYLAFLNHDDLWLPAHLEHLTRGLHETKADLVFALSSIVQADGTRWLGGTTPTGRYEPYLSVNASAWLMRRSLAGEVGPWRHYRECRVAPSQDWLLRARRAGHTLRLVPRLTVVALPSGYRPRSYADRQDLEHREMARRLQNESDFVERELTSIALTHASRDPVLGASLDVRTHATRAVANAVRRLLLAAGITPAAARLGFRRRGAIIDAFRKTRGLPRKDR